MVYTIRYGAGSALALEFASAKVTADLANPLGVALDDVPAAVQAAVADPLDFPPLASAIVPGDRVVIAIDRGVPRACELVGGLAASLLESVPQIGSITVVVPEDDEAPVRDLPSVLRAKVTVEVHDPADQEKLSYLAASREGKPIYINKTVCDADVVLPVGTAQLDESLGNLGVHSGLFPVFSDEQTLRRFRAPLTHDWSTHHRRRREEVDEAAWLLGIQMTVQVVPGAAEELLAILAGEARAVAEQGQAACRAAWLHEIPQSVPLVVAAIDGAAEQQTWDNLARALFAASQAVNEGGAILVCSQLRGSAGPALMRLVECPDDRSALHDIRRDRSSDALLALTLAGAKEKARIYLLSDLDRDLVEGLGVGYVSDSDDIERLGRQYESCLLLGSAQHAAVRLPTTAGVEG